MSNLLETFAAWCKNNDYTPDTNRQYDNAARVWLAWCGARQLDPLLATKGDVEAHRDEMRARKLSPASVAHRVIIVRSFYESLLDADLVSANPAGRVRARRGVRGGNYKAFSREQLAHLLASFQSDDIETLRDRAMVALMALHGLRCIEVHKLNGVPTGKGN